MNPTNRENIWPGRRVAIVQKQHQGTGELTQGMVADILTNSPNHPRGIKVRLESGEIGRVQVIYES
ncbi:MAG: YwbE family protein [Parcubacteria group bacterium]|nr:YwbE family protein [Parcubacteria group bacterium]